VKRTNVEAQQIEAQFARIAKKPLLTVEQTDELILAACTREDGAIEDCEVEPTEVRYFFESDAIGRVSRTTGQVTINRGNPYEEAAKS
jgi:hypothetical protein